MRRTETKQYCSNIEADQMTVVYIETGFAKLSFLFFGFCFCFWFFLVVLGL
jgi:hypothetical protein